MLFIDLRIFYVKEYRSQQDDRLITQNIEQVKKIDDPLSIIQEPVLQSRFGEYSGSLLNSRDFKSVVKSGQRLIVVNKSPRNRIHEVSR